MKRCILLLILFTFWASTAQQKIKVQLDDELHQLIIHQEIQLVKPDNFKDSVYWFHNWPNAYSSNKTQLAKRFLEDYSNSFYFASDKQKGYSDIEQISIDGILAKWEVYEDKVKIQLPPGLKNSFVVELEYTIQLPRDKFTGYGWSKTGYNLKYWYLNPVVYKDNKWKLMSNLNLNDLLSDYQDFEIKFEVPAKYILYTDLEQESISKNGKKYYNLSAKNRQHIEINLSSYDAYNLLNTASIDLITDMPSMELDPGLIQNIADRQLAFIEEYLGKLNRKQLIVSRLDYERNPVYGFNQLPNFLAPFQNNFLWDIKFLKVLTKRYMDELVQYDKREDYWLMDAMQTWIMMNYVSKYYPDEKALGGLTKLPFFKNYYLAQLEFNGKYLTLYQYISRRNLDQSLTTPRDELSNFNRKITNKYKGGLGLNYLDNYLQEINLKEELREIFALNQGKYLSSNALEDKLPRNTDWFFDYYVQTNRQIDLKIKKIENDTIVNVKNKSGFDLPYTLTTLKKNNVVNQYWIESNATKINIPKDSSDRVSINYELSAPEVRLHDNWKKKGFSLSNKPLDVRLFKDLDNPNKNQIFYTPEFVYNFYDGVTLGLALSNKTILAQDFLFKVTPAYGFKSKSLTGSFGISYRVVPKDSDKIRNVFFGASGSYFHYAEDLSYTRFTPYAGINFKRKNLRDVGGRYLSVNYTHVDKDPNPAVNSTDEINKYGVVNLNYGFTRPALINDLRYNLNLQWEQRFTKASLDIRYRKLTNRKRQLDFRLFAGVFLRNKTTTDYFSFALDRPTNYLFNYNFLGTSETTGFFSQQIIIAEGGFKSNVNNPYANQWMTTANASVALWRWIEVYGDAGFTKSRNQPVFFGYDAGVRLNFVHNILELYFPLYSNLGWETKTDNYAEKIRFVLTLDPGAVLNFVRRGFI